MSAIIHFINLYAQSGGAVTASAAKAGQDAFVRDWMAAAKSGGATRGRLGNKPPPTTPRSDFLSRRRGWSTRAKRARGNKPPPRQPGSLAADARRKASLAPPKAPPPLVKRWLADPTPAATHWSYRAGKAGGSGGIYGTQRIPRTIVQTSGILANVAMDERRWSRGWRRHNPEYEYLLLDDYACRGFVMRHAALHERHAFNAVATGAQRADLFRAYWLREVPPPPPRNSAARNSAARKFGPRAIRPRAIRRQPPTHPRQVGGIYADLDTELNAPLRTFVPRNASAVAGGWWDFSFLAYEPRHPIIVELARRATEEVLHQSLMVAVRHQFPCIGSVGCVLHTTGPMMCAAAR